MWRFREIPCHVLVLVLYLLASVLTFVHSGLEMFRAAIFSAHILVLCLLLKTEMSPSGESGFTVCTFFFFMKDYLDLWCRRAYVPSWLTCLICLCMANSKDVESHRVTHSGHTPLPFYPALLQIACQKWCVGACVYLYTALVKLMHCCWRRKPSMAACF